MALITNKGNWQSEKWILQLLNEFLELTILNGQVTQVPPKNERNNFKQETIQSMINIFYIGNRYAKLIIISDGNPPRLWEIREE